MNPPLNALPTAAPNPTPPSANTPSTSANSNPLPPTNGSSTPHANGNGNNGNGNGSASQNPQRRMILLNYTSGEIKKKLQQQLGKEKTDLYLKHFQDYLIGKLTKPEYEEVIKKLLPDAHRKLHNIFILSILRSSYSSLYKSNSALSGTAQVQSQKEIQSLGLSQGQSNVNVALTQELRKSSKVSKNLGAAAPSNTLNLSASVPSLSTSPVASLASSSSAIPPTPGTEGGTAPMEECSNNINEMKCARTFEHIPSFSMPRTLDNLTTRDITKQPLYTALLNEVQCKAAHLGLSVSSSYITLLFLALEHHIKTIVSSTRNQKLRKKFAKPKLLHQNLLKPEQQLQKLGYPHKQLMDVNRPGTIDLLDLQLAIEASEKCGANFLPNYPKILDYANLNRKED
eukprot:TRINITY_DN11376_c0_g1_i1.p1 TRINITY_DN11376_c0_g1~~TRINITY_DN11376_c0_g1_i1.p1  ORF type:complete len:399 (+),score=95.57 TRINITY_DN11376_c0_g1_i1:109-1305(+)